MYVIELYTIKLHTMIKNILLLILMVLMGTVAWANIVYTDITPDNNYSSGGSFDFDNDGTNEMNTIDGKYIGLSDCRVWTMGASSPNDIIPKPLSLNTVIGTAGYFSSNTYASMDNWGSGTSFPLNVDAYLAFRFTVSGNDYYGWMRVMYDGTHFVYKDYAYEDIPNTLILAGDTGSSVGTYDIVMDSVFMDPIVMKGSIQVKGRIRNVGSNPIDTFDVVYTIDGGSPTAVYTIIANQSITNNQVYDFTCNAPWNANSLGNHIVKIIVSNPNGHTDINVNNNSKSSSVLVLNEKYTKTIVCEEIGGTWCKFCPRGLVGLNKMAHNHPDSLWIGIAIHIDGYCYSDYPGEPMLVPEYADSIGTILQYAPTAVIDRNRDAIVNMTMNQLSESYNKHIVEIPIAKTSISNQIWDNANRSFTIETNTEFALDITSADYRLALVVLEDDVKDTAKGWEQHDYYQGGSTPMVDWDGFSFNTKGTLVIEGDHYVPAELMHYNHVARQLIGGWHGVANSIPANITHSTQYLYTFTGNIPTDNNPNNSSFVVLLIDNTTGKIINANKVESNTTIGIAKTKVKNNISIYPNPSNGVFRIENVGGSRIEIFNITGQRVYSRNAVKQIETLNLSFLNSGSYIIRISNNDFVSTKHIVIEN